MPSARPVRRALDTAIFSLHLVRRRFRSISCSIVNWAVPSIWGTPFTIFSTLTVAFTVLQAWVRMNSWVTTAGVAHSLPGAAAALFNPAAAVMRTSRPPRSSRPAASDLRAGRERGGGVRRTGYERPALDGPKNSISAIATCFLPLAP